MNYEFVSWFDRMLEEVSRAGRIPLEGMLICKNFGEQVRHGRILPVPSLLTLHAGNDLGQSGIHVSAVRPANKNENRGLGSDTLLLEYRNNTIQVYSMYDWKHRDWCCLHELWQGTYTHSFKLWGGSSARNERRELESVLSLTWPWVGFSHLGSSRNRGYIKKQSRLTPTYAQRAFSD